MRTRHWMTRYSSVLRYSRVVLLGTDWYRGNDASERHRDDIPQLDFRRTSNRALFAPVNYESNISYSYSSSCDVRSFAYFAANNWEKLANVLSDRRWLPDGDICIADDEGTATRPFDASWTFMAAVILIFLNVCKSLMSIFSCGVSRSNQRLK